MLVFDDLRETIKFFVVNVKMFLQLVDPLYFRRLTDLLNVILILLIRLLELSQLRFQRFDIFISRCCVFFT